MPIVRPLFLALALPILAHHAPAAPAVSDPVSVFTREAEDAYAAIRIPAIVQSKGGTLLAFAEGRVLDSDHGENDIILRRSTDGGATWGEITVVAESGGDSLNDPCALALHDPDRILLVYHRYPQGYHGRAMEHAKRVEPGYGGPDNAQSFIIQSDDDGATWSKPREITRALREPSVIAVGAPGNFIQLRRGPHAGRLVLPLYENMPIGEGDRHHDLRAAWSDDLGETWQLGTRIDYSEITGWGTEPQVAETANGELLYSARLHDGGLGRILATSADGGATWSPARIDRTLETTPCMGSLVARVDGERTTLFHTIPNSPDKRWNGALFRSDDQGASWVRTVTIDPADFAYSALVVLNDGRLGCLYEDEHYKNLSFVTINPD